MARKTFYRRLFLLIGLGMVWAGGNTLAADWTVGKRSLLYIRVDFPDLPGPPVADAVIQKTLAEVETYIHDNSYGRLELKCTATPTLRLPQTQQFYETNKDQEQIIRDARDAARRAGFDTRPFTLDIVAFRTHNRAGSEVAAVGGKGVRILNDFRLGITLHAIGHNLGLPHSNLWLSGDGPIIGPGTSEDHGDGYDPMGGGGNEDAARNHFVIRSKAKLGWLDPDRLADATAGGTFRLYAQDLPGDGVRGLKIKRDDLIEYWIEFRQRLSDNANAMNGIRILRGHRLKNTIDLLSANPGSPNRFRDAAFPLGQTFTDAEAGLYVTPVAIRPTDPPSVDVVINRGQRPNRAEPKADLNIETTTVATNRMVDMKWDIASPEKESLYYAWDFGDGRTASGTAAVSPAWPADGHYRVTATVADGWGFVRTEERVVTVGRPRTRLVEGVVNGPAGGVAGVWVNLKSADEPTENAVAKAALPVGWNRLRTDRDGRFTAIGLPPGSYVFSPAKKGYSILPAKVTIPAGKKMIFFAANSDEIDKLKMASLKIAVQVDGRDELRITPQALLWRHYEFSWPSNVQVNGVAIDPQKASPNPLRAAFTRGRLRIESAVLLRASGRGKIETYRDRDGLLVSFHDTDAGAAMYEIEIGFPDQ